MKRLRQHEIFRMLLLSLIVSSCLTGCATKIQSDSFCSVYRPEYSTEADRLCLATCASTALIKLIGDNKDAYRALCNKQEPIVNLTLPKPIPPAPSAPP